MIDRCGFDDYRISPEKAKTYIRKGINSEIEFWVMNTKTSQYQFIEPRQLQDIYSKHPKHAKIRLEDVHVNQRTYNISSPGHEQNINYLDLWFDRSKFQVILRKDTEYSDREQEVDKFNDAHCMLLEKSPYYLQLNQLITKAINEYPTWREQQNKVQLTANLIEWLTKTIGANTREADIIKNILSNLHIELK